MSLHIIGGVLASDLQLDARHGDQVEQDHQRPWMEPLQRQQSWGEPCYTILWRRMSLVISLKVAVMNESNYVVHFVPCDFVTLEQSGSRSERFESLTGKLTKIINGPVWKLYNFSRAEVRNILQGGFINKEVHAVGLVSMWFLHLGGANTMNCIFCCLGGKEQADHPKCDQGRETVWGNVQVHICSQVPIKQMGSLTWMKPPHYTPS